MKDSELHDTPFPDTWDNTMRGLAISCPRKLYFFLRGFDYASEQKPPYFVWGSAWEEILATWYSGGEAIKDPSSPAYQTHAYISLQMGLELWDEAKCEDQGLNKRASFEPIWKAYLDEYPTERWTFVERGAETGWTFPLVGTPYFLGGSYDGFVDFPPYGLAILENKTTGAYVTEGLVGSWLFSPQVTGYIWNAQKLIGSNCAGCLVNIVTKNLPGPRSKWTTPRFARVLVKKTPAQLEDFERHAAWHIRKIYEDHWVPWYWPQSLDKDQCAGGIGKAPCLFKTICLSGVPVSEVDHAHYPNIALRDGPWQPWLRWGEQNE